MKNHLTIEDLEDMYVKEYGAGNMRKFKTGATRNIDNNKLDYEGFISPAVFNRFAKYMHKNRIQADGTLRESDNWQKGIERDVYMKSLIRHTLDLWRLHRGEKVINPDTNKLSDKEELLCAIIFNTQGYLFEELKLETLKRGETMAHKKPPKKVKKVVRVSRKHKRRR